MLHYRLDRSILEIYRSAIGTMRDNFFDIGAFLKLGRIELERARRYRIFSALIIFDLTSVEEAFGSRADKVLGNLREIAHQNIRSSDVISGFDKYIALMVLETPRQGAEVTSRRIADRLRDELKRHSGGSDVEQTIGLEISSFPDTAGARPMDDMLAELAHRHRN